MQPIPDSWHCVVKMLTDKTPVALPIKLLVTASVGLVGLGGALYAAKSEAAIARQQIEAHTTQLQDHEKRIQRGEDDGRHTQESLDRIENMVNKMLVRSQGGR